jgi:hypothetical protein
LIAVGADRLGSEPEHDFDVGKVPLTVHIHFNADGTQLVVMKSPAFHVALVVNGPLVTFGPVRLNFSSIGLNRLDSHLDGLGALAHLLLNRRLVGSTDRPGVVDYIRLRDALICLDGKASGASHRDIAQVIHGGERVATEWGDTDSPMRQKIKRDLLRGRRLMNGGYRDLLSKWQQGSLARTA